MDVEEIWLSTVDSTQLFAKREAHTFSKEKITCIIADEQTAGRGRFNRTWLSSKGKGLYVTFAFHLKKNHPLSALPQVLAYSVITTLERENIHCQIKWPNDILLDTKKAGGILSEVVFEKEDALVFLGLGLNFSFSEKELAPFHGISLPIHVSIASFLKLLEKELVKNLLLFKERGFFPFKSKVEAHLAFRGEKISCSEGTQKWTGICHSLTEEGFLNILLENGEMYTLRSGEISHLRLK